MTTDTSTSSDRGDKSFRAYSATRRNHWETFAAKLDGWRGWGGYYHRRTAALYRLLVPEGLRVLDLGCGRGDLLAALKPVRGVGVDFSAAMIAAARDRHPELSFITADVHELALDEEFDVIILSDLVNDLWDVQRVFRRIAPLAAPGARIILNTYNHLWEQPLKGAQKLRLAAPLLNQNWLTVEDLADLLALEDFEVVKRFQEIIYPLATWPLHHICNSFLVKLWPFRHLALTNFIVARPVGRPTPEREPVVSVIVPARNEAGNIAEIFRRTPEMGGGTELIFVEGGSSDDTYAVIEREIAARPDGNCRLFRQTGKGKGDAVRLGFAEARGEVLMILDADMTVPPEDLPRFYEALRSGKGEFINGVRLVYPMEKQAMRFLNLLGNKFFSLAFSWLLGQPVKDTLCGTKVLRKKDYERIAAGRSYFGDFDPFGDFDLLFGAAKLNLKMVQVPIRYRERTYGETNIQRFRHGLILLRMVMFAARKIKFT
ncbi:MAG TPA: glycosyltransferase [Geobacteraceae bacterium]|nr:glycosyltransferase [Geobacteraceae bacterium]